MPDIIIIIEADNDFQHVIFKKLHNTGWVTSEIMGEVQPNVNVTLSYPSGVYLLKNTEQQNFRKLPSDIRELFLPEERERLGSILVLQSSPETRFLSDLHPIL